LSVLRASHDVKSLVAGIFNTIACLPLLAMLHFSGVERFTLPTGMDLLFLSINGFFGTVLPNLLWAKVISANAMTRYCDGNPLYLKKTEVLSFRNHMLRCSPSRFDVL
jgi:drug/metabolite transporter (DMT)-like permease